MSVPYDGINQYPTSGCANSGTSCYNPEELFSQWTNGGLPLIEVTAQSMPGWTYVFFETEELFADNNSRVIQLKSKEFPERIDYVRTNANGQIVRYEKTNGFTKTQITASVVGSNVITVTDIADLQGIGPNTSILINTTDTLGQKAVIAVIVSISGNDITLDRNITVNAGDRLFRGANNRDYCEAISNTYTPTCEVEYYSNFQSLQLSMTFRGDDLAKDRVIYSYGANEQAYIDRLWKPARQGFVRELGHVILFGENTATNTSLGVKTTTRGIFPSLEEAETCSGEQFTYDFASCCGTDDDDMAISSYLDVIRNAYDSGYYKDGVMTAMINSAQRWELLKMRPSFLSYAGIQVYEENRQTHSGMYDFLTLRVISLQTDFARVEFVLDEILSSYYPTMPVMLIFPRSMVGMYQRKFEKVDSNMRAVANSGVPTLEMKDITPYISYLNGGDECFSFVGKVWFALAFGGIYNGAWRAIFNLKSYKSCNNTCTPPVYDFILPSGS